MYMGCLQKKSKLITADYFVLFLYYNFYEYNP